MLSSSTSSGLSSSFSGTSSSNSSKCCEEPQKMSEFSKELCVIRQRILDSYLFYTGQPFTGYSAVPNVLCQLCQSSLKFKGASMIHHVMKHSNEKVFQCSHCDFGSNFSYTVASHAQKKHGLEGSDCREFRDRRPQLDQTLASLVRECFPASVFE